VDILAFLSRNGAQNMGLVEDYGFIAGNGGSLQPNGILNSGASTTDISGTTADTVSNTTSDAGSAPKIATWIYSLPSQYLANARFVFRRALEGQIRALTDFQSRPLWPETPFGPTPRSIFGYPLANSEFLEATGTNANRVAVWGDLSAYVIAQRAQISTVVLRERFADTDQTGIIIFERVGGDTWNTDAIRLGIV
jgi:HK97 family phage major capsid protein